MAASSDAANADPWEFLTRRLSVARSFGLSMAALNATLAGKVEPGVEPLGVLPDPTLHSKLSWSAVAARVPKSSLKPRFVDHGEIEQLLKEKEKKKFEEKSLELWPARSKTDLALRRTRLRDWVQLYAGSVRKDEIREVLRATREGYDIIFVTNLVAATWTFGVGWWRRWKWLGAFDGDLGHYIAVAKKVHDLAKSVGLAEEKWMWFAECSVLSGYRNMPFPGFDVFGEAAELADGGDPHLYYGHSWKELCREFLPMRKHKATFTPFKEWVEAGGWLTSGASSVGRVEIAVDGKVRRVKARKNMVADVVDLGELAADALSDSRQSNVTIIKSELGKLRLAVAGDIHTYLKMTWINDLLGGAYYDWPGNTSEEDFEAQTKRLDRMLQLCAKCFGLPYDYQGFDHQPTLTELLHIVDRLIEHARLSVPFDNLGQFDEVANSVRVGFRNATLTTTFDGKTETKKVGGGLMSGLRWTSVVGNAWNTVMTGLAMKLLVAWGIPVVEIERFIRGDDSAIFVPNWATGAAMNLAYQAIGVKAGEGKFSIQYRQMEFLRVWFNTRTHGYPVRSVPGLTQRKPWSSQPWSEDMVLRALYDAFKTIRRRAPEIERNCELAWGHLKRQWCRNHNLPVLVVCTPATSGGLGIEPPPVGRHLRAFPAVPKVAGAEAVEVLNQNTWRSKRLVAYAAERYGVDVSGLADELARKELVSTLVADNVPEVATAVRQGWLKEVRAAGVRVESTLIPFGSVTPSTAVGAYPPGRVSDLLERLKAVAPMFGLNPELATARADYAKFEFSGGFKAFVRRYYPGAWANLVKFHSSWHISEAVDYLEGRVPVLTQVLHPALTKVLAWLVAGNLQPKKRTVRTSSLWLGSLLEPHVVLAPISRLTYAW